MRIYLDSSVFQLLKNDENYSTLLKTICEDKDHNIYSYSSAHIQDLTRDKSDQKIEDLKFIENIVDDNCWFFDDRTIFEHIPPTEYFGEDSFPEYQEKVVDTEKVFDENVLLNPLKEMFQSFTLPISSNFTDQTLPEKYPLKMKELLDSTNSFWDMMVGIGNLINEMAAKQKSFKEMISFLHGDEIMRILLQNLGIEGHNGTIITDKEKFRTSYINYFTKTKQEISKYDLFKQMYFGLETFGLVKGQPKKQKLLNLIDDGSHAYFGGLNDILVTRDDDMRNKTRFMFTLFDIDVQAFNIDEFQEFLVHNRVQRNNSIHDMLKELRILNDFSERMLDQQHEDDKTATVFKMKGLYYNYFDILTFVQNSDYYWCYFGKQVNNYSQGTLIKEITYVNDRLINDLGEDLYHRTLFSPDEIVDEKWCGRIWRIDTVFIYLNYSGKMFLEVFFPDVPKNSQDPEQS